MTKDEEIERLRSWQGGALETIERVRKEHGAMTIALRRSERKLAKARASRDAAYRKLRQFDVEASLREQIAGVARELRVAKDRVEWLAPQLVVREDQIYELQKTIAELRGSGGGL